MIDPSGTDKFEAVIALLHASVNALPEKQRREMVEDIRATLVKTGLEVTAADESLFARFVLGEVGANEIEDQFAERIGGPE